MRNIILVITALSVLSCRSENQNENIPTVNPLIGTWKMEKTSKISGVDKKTVLGENLPDDCKKKSTYEFTAANKYIGHDFNTINSDCVETTFERLYEYNENQKTIKINGTISEVLEISNTKLVFLAPDNYDYNNDGIDDFIKYNFYK